MDEFIFYIALMVFLVVVVIALNGISEDEKDSVTNIARKKSQDEAVKNSEHEIIASKKQKEIRALKPISNIVEQAKIAQKSIETYPMDELVDVLELLEKDADILDAVDIFNEQIRSTYLEFLKPVTDRYNLPDKEVYAAQLAIDLSRCMALGRASVLKSPEVQSVVNLTGDVEIKSTKISKSHSWEELKDKF